MDDKNKARLLRELAYKLDGVAKTYTSLGWHGTATHYQKNAEHYRLQADKLDHTFEVGSYIRDAYGHLWRCEDVDKWSNGIVTLSTKSSYISTRCMCLNLPK